MIFFIDSIETDSCSISVFLQQPYLHSQSCNVLYLPCSQEVKRVRGVGKDAEEVGRPSEEPYCLDPLFLKKKVTQFKELSLLKNRKYRNISLTLAGKEESHLTS